MPGSGYKFADPRLTDYFHSSPGILRKKKTRISSLPRGQRKNVALLLGIRKKISSIVVGNLKGNMVDVDEEWIKFTTANKKGENVTKIVRLDKGSGVEIGTE